MQSSKNRHNFFSKVDHDKSFVETNYSPPKTESPKTPLASFDVRKKLAASDLSVKLNAKSPVITASSLAVYEDENPFDDSQVQYHDVDSSSVASNHSRELNHVKNALSKKVSDNIHYTAIAFTGSRDLFDEEKIDEALQLNLNTQRTRGYSDMTENNLESDEEDEHLFGESTYLPYESTTGNRERAQSGNSVHSGHSGINSGMYSTQKPTQFSSTLEVHRSFMRAAEEKDTLKSIQAVGSVKVLGSPALSSSKHMNNSSPSQESVKKFTGSPALQSHKTLSSGSPAQQSHKKLRPMTPVEFGSKKFSGVPAASSGSPSSSPATPFNRKQSGATNGATANQGDTSPDSKAAEGRGLGQSLLSSASKSFMFLSKLSHGTPTPSANNHNNSNTSNNNAGKENNSSGLTLQVPAQSSSSPQSSPSFTTPQKGSKPQLTPLGSPAQPQGLGSHPHNHSGNEMKEMMSMMKQAHHNLAHQNLIREMGATPSEQGDNHSVMSAAALAKHEPLYEVTQLKALHENKANRPVLNLLDKAVAALSFQRKPPSRTPPPPIQPSQLTLKSIFSENELINAGISHETAVDDEEFFKMIRETTKPRTKKRIAMGLGPEKTESRDHHQTTKPSADEVVNDIAKYLHNETRASTAGKVTSSSSDYNLYSSPSPTKPPQHNHNSSSASMKQSVAPPLLDFSKVKPNPMTPINGSIVSGGSQSQSQSQSQYDSQSQSQSYSQSQSQQSSAISRLPDILAPKPAQQVPQPLYSGGNYAKALSPATQTYIAGIYGNNTPPGGGSLDRTPVLTRSSTFGEGGEDDDLRDLRLVSQQAHGQSHHSFKHVTQSAETALTIFDQQQPMSARSTRSATSQYKYQHSTTSYVPKEVNQASFGLYSRHPARPDIEFSERHLAAIHDNTAGNSAPVIYIPTDSTHHVSLAKHQSGNVPPGSSVSLYKPHGSSHSMHSNSLSSSKLAHNKAAVSFHTGTVVQESNYNEVARQLNYTNSTPNLPHHSSSMPQLVKKGGGSAHSSSQMALLNNNYGSPTTHETKSLVPHNDHNHSQYSNYSVSSPDIRTEINDYIQKISSPATVLEEQDDAPYSARSELTHTSNVSEARDQLWYKLHHRYSGDREGVATTQLKVKEYLLEAVVEENHIMRDYMKEMDDGW